MWICLASKYNTRSITSTKWFRPKKNAKKSINEKSSFARFLIYFVCTRVCVCDGMNAIKTGFKSHIILRFEQ